MKKLSSILLFFIALHSVAAQNDASGHNKVRASAEQWVLEQLGEQHSANGRLDVSATKIDSRIQIPNCASPFAAQSSPNALTQSMVTVKVHCPTSDWFIYVMVKVQQLQSVVVTSVPLSPGTVLSQRHLSITEVDKNRVRGTTYANLTELVGARLKHRVRANEPITPRLLCFVCEGDKVDITAETGTLTIKTSGIALQDGNVGDTIRVRNRRSERLVDARVVNSGAVSVSL